MRDFFVNSKNKRVVCWGAGDIYRKCMNNHPEFIAEFVIDKNTNISVENAKVIHPSQIGDFSDIFIVITTIKQESIRKYLNEIGLKEYEDYIGFEKFWGDEKTVSRSIEEIKGAMLNENENTLIIGPFLLSRDSKRICEFINRYAKANSQRKHILLECSEGLLNSKTNPIEFECFEIAKICLYNGFDEDEFIDFSDEICDISDAEKKWIDTLENNKHHDNAFMAKKIVGTIYQYFKRIIETLNFHRVLFWGAWDRNYYIVKKICENNQIPFCCMEFGWIKGTIQVGSDTDVLDKLYRQNVGVAETMHCDEKCLNYISTLYNSNHLLYKMNDEENSRIQKIYPNNPYILAVGVSDSRIGFLKGSEYQKRYISSVVDSSIDLLDTMIDVCTKNKWNLIFKPHPIDRYDVQYDKYKNNEHVCFIDDIAIEKLIDISNVVVSIFSKSDYVVLAHNKPLVLVGNYSLSRSGATYTVSEKTDVENQIMNAIKYGYTEQQKNAFINNVQDILTKYAWRTDDNSWGLDLNTDFFE